MQIHLQISPTEARQGLCPAAQLYASMDFQHVLGTTFRCSGGAASSLVTEPSLQARINTPSLAVPETESGPVHAGQILCLQLQPSPPHAPFL